MLSIRIEGVSTKALTIEGVGVAWRFLSEYHDRKRGRRHGVIYSGGPPWTRAWYAYFTKRGQIVVCYEEKESADEDG